MTLFVSMNFTLLSDVLINTMLYRLHHSQPFPIRRQGSIERMIFQVIISKKYLQTGRLY